MLLNPATLPSRAAQPSPIPPPLPPVLSLLQISRASTSTKASVEETLHPLKRGAEKVVRLGITVAMSNGAVEVSSDVFDPVAAMAPETLPPVAVNGEANGDHSEGKRERERREIVLGKNVHTTCLDVTEPDADDESTGDKDAYMASVLARYRKTLIERTKHHLGIIFNSSGFDLLVRANL